MVGVFSFFENMNRLILSVILLVVVICLAVRNSGNKPKTISPTEVAQSQSVATPVEEKNNRQMESSFTETQTVISPAVPETVTVEVKMVRLSRGAKPPTSSAQQTNQNQ